MDNADILNFQKSAIPLVKKLLEIGKAVRLPLPNDVQSSEIDLYCETMKKFFTFLNIERMDKAVIISINPEIYERDYCPYCLTNLSSPNIIQEAQRMKYTDEYQNILKCPICSHPLNRKAGYDALRQEEP